MRKARQPILWQAAVAMLGFAAVIFFSHTSAFSQTIIDEWNTVKAPPAPELKPVTIDPNGTALLLLDFVKQICSPQVISRCVASLPKVIVPVDGMSSEDPYIEQYVVQQFVGAIATRILRGAVTVTKLSLIRY